MKPNPPPEEPARPTSGGRGEASATDAQQLLIALYEDLRQLARQRMAREHPGHSLQATVLVHEAYLRIAGDKPEGWASRAQFFHAAAEAMRRILIENARARGSQKRGGGRRHVTLTGVDLATDEPLEDIVAVDEAFQRFEQADPRAAEVVRLRFFAGLDEAETAAVLGVSDRTVRREWSYARAWLLDALHPPR